MVSMTNGNKRRKLNKLFASAHRKHLLFVLSMDSVTNCLTEVTDMVW